MRFLRPLGKGLALALGLFLALGLVLPRGWRVERSVLIAAPPERIAPYLLDLRRWQEWSAWTRALDPQVRHAYAGPPSGVGASWSWLGPVLGRGTLTITWADPRRGLRLDQAIESDQVNAHAELTLAPEGARTRLTWVDEGQLPLLGGWFRGQVERKLGQGMEAGLARLRWLAETPPPP